MFFISTRSQFSTTLFVHEINIIKKICDTTKCSSRIGANVSGKLSYTFRTVKHKARLHNFKCTFNPFITPFKFKGSSSYIHSGGRVLCLFLGEPTRFRCIDKILYPAHALFPTRILSDCRKIN